MKTTNASPKQTTQPKKIQNIFCQKYQLGRFQLFFLGLGWPWVAKFVGSI